MSHICNECHEEIPTGHAVIRAINFERRAFHRECWALRLLPEQRPPADRPVA